MKRIFLLLLAVGGYLAYRRRQEERAGYEATAAAEPFSSESLSDADAAPPDPAEEVSAEPPSTPAKEPGDNTKDTLERPTWLQPADAAEGCDGDAG